MGPAATLAILVKAQGIQTTTGQLTTLDKAGRKAGKGLETTEKHAKRTAGVMSGLGTAAKSAGLLVGAAGLAAGVKVAIGEFREAQKVGAQTNAVLKSTGNAAKVTKKHIENLSGAISKKSGIDDEAIQTGANLLLTFKDIRNETGKGNKIFDQATQVITDMSVAMKQGLKPSAIQVGKALNDPVKGLSALGRVGVQFTEDQKKQVEALVKSGDKLAAQKIILRELKSEFAGSAAAQATAGDKLKVAWGNLAEAAGGILVPALDKAARWLTRVLDAAIEGKGIARFIVPAFDAIHDAVKTVLDQGKALTQWFKDHEALAKTTAAAVSTVAAAFIAIKTAMAISGALSSIGGGLAAIGLATGPVLLVVAALAALAGGFVYAYNTSKPFHDAVDGAFNAIKNAVPGVLAALASVPSAVVSAFNAVKATVQSVTNSITTEIGKWKVAFAVFGVIAAVAKVNMGILVTVVKAGLQLLAPVFTATFGVIKAVVTGAWSALKVIVQGGLNVIGGIVKVFGGILKGDFGQMWEGVKQIFRGIGGAIKGILQAQLGTIRDAGKALAKGLIDGFKAAFNLAHELAERMRDLIKLAPGFALGVGKAIVEGIISGIKAAAGGIGGALKGALKGATPDFLGIGDGIGRKLPKGGKGSAALMGANASLGPFAAVGARYGLHVSSGLRPGATTSSGNPSYHASGQAIDEAGSPAGMMAFFKFMRSTFGSRLAELIYTPGGVGIKDGKPHTYTGQVAADHFDHVHVALGGGPFGDGIGKRMRGHLMGDGYGNTGLQSLWTRAGGPASAANIAAAVALAESGGRSTATHRNTNGSIDRGLWQINSVHGALSTLNPLGNAKAAVKISSGGRNWNPWVTFKTGAYKKFLGAAAKGGKGGKKGAKIKPSSKVSHGTTGKVGFGGFSPQQIEDINAEAAHKAEAASAATLGAGGSDEDAGAAADAAMQASIDALTEQLRLTNEKLALQATLAQDALRKYNVSQTDYGTLAKAIASVASGEIGGKIGLGFMTPGFSGGGSRY